MSVQFGSWNFDGRPADRQYLAKAEGMLAPYGPDGGGTYIKDSVGILFRAFHTTKESRNETQPHTTPSGVVLTWDGRLDNCGELIRSLRDVLTILTRPTFPSSRQPMRNGEPAALPSSLGTGHFPSGTRKAAR